MAADGAAKPQNHGLCGRIKGGQRQRSRSFAKKRPVADSSLVVPYPGDRI
jgi:hypothetical protein